MEKVIRLIVAFTILIICTSGCCWGNFVFPYPLVEPSVYYQGEKGNNSDASNNTTSIDTISNNAKDETLKP